MPGEGRARCIPQRPRLRPPARGRVSSLHPPWPLIATATGFCFEGAGPPVGPGRQRSRSRLSVPVCTDVSCKTWSGGGRRAVPGPQWGRSGPFQTWLHILGCSWGPRSHLSPLPAPGHVTRPLSTHSCARRRAAWPCASAPAVAPSTRPASACPGPRRGGSPAPSARQASAASSPTDARPPWPRGSGTWQARPVGSGDASPPPPAPALPPRRCWGLPFD